MIFEDDEKSPTRGHRRGRPVQGGPPRTIGQTTAMRLGVRFSNDKR